MLENPEFAVGISMISVILSEILVFPVWRPYCYFRLSIVFEITVFEIATVDAARFAAEKKQI